MQIGVWRGNKNQQLFQAPSWRVIPCSAEECREATRGTGSRQELSSEVRLRA